MSEVVRAGVVVLATVLKKELERKERERQRRRTVWVKSWIQKRQQFGASSTLLRELRDEDPLSYRNILRMNPIQFDCLLQMVHDIIQRKDTKLRRSITAQTKLEITLRYLASGDSLKSLEYLFRVPECAISTFLPEVLSAVALVLQPFIKVSKKRFIAKMYYTNK